MTFLIPDRKSVGQIRYQLKRFESQCLNLPVETQLRIQREMHGLRKLLDEHLPDRCSEYGGICKYERVPYQVDLYCVHCGSPAPLED